MNSNHSFRNTFIGLFLFGSALFSVDSAFGQIESSSPAKIKKWKYTQFDFGVGIDQDHFYRMSLSRLMAFAENPEDLQRDLAGMEEEVSTSTAGLSLYLNRSFSPWSESLGKYRENRVIRVGVGLHSPKESMISYKNESLDTSIVFCNRHGEFTLEAAYLERGTWGKRDQFTWYWGGGFNASASFSNEMIIMEGQYFEKGAHPSTQVSLPENTTFFIARPVTYARFYIPYGVHAKVGEKWTVGFDARRGFGVQSILGGESNFIRKTGSFVLGAKYTI